MAHTQNPKPIIMQVIKPNNCIWTFFKGVIQASALLTESVYIRGVIRCYPPLKSGHQSNPEVFAWLQWAFPWPLGGAVYQSGRLGPWRRSGHGGSVRLRCTEIYVGGRGPSCEKQPKVLFRKKPPRCGRKGLHPSLYLRNQGRDVEEPLQTRTCRLVPALWESQAIPARLCH